MSLDTRLTDEQATLRKTVEEFAREVVAPVSYAHDKAKTFPYEVVQGMAEMGLFGLPFPEEHGGMGGDSFALCLALEELARVDQSVAITLEAGVSLGAMPVYRFGTDEQKATWLPMLTSGEALGAFGLTEAGRRQRRRRHPHDGGARGRQLAHQRQQGVHHQLGHRHHPPGHRHGRHRRDGQRQEGDQLDPRPGADARLHRRAGLRQGRLERLRHPPADLRGRAGAGGEPARHARRGYANFLSILDEGRIAISALAVGAAQGCVDESVKYAKQREAFGRPIAANQAIAFKIARMEARVHVARTAYYDAAAKMLAGLPFKKEAAIAKMVSGEAAMDNARDATQVHGGYGFMNEYVVSRHYRDSKILEVGEGTTEVQLMLIARELGL
jgi:alkylation response protein AidB-like acyl-CoA dehydrogenase